MQTSIILNLGLLSPARGLYKYKGGHSNYMTASQSLRKVLTQ